MRINRTIITRAILTLGAAGSIMAGTVAPIWANPSAVALPIPEVAPLIQAVLPSSLFMPFD